MKNVGRGNWFGHSKTPPSGDGGGVLALGTRRPISAIRALNAQLGDQARNRDHHSGDPRSQA